MSAKTVLVTGSYGGIGFAAAQLLSEHGADVIAVDVRQERPPEMSPGIRYVSMDVSSPQAWDQIMANEVGDAGLDVLVSAAGIASAGSIHDLSLDHWDRVIAVNQTGVMLGMRAAVRSMLAHGRGGSLVAVSSIWGSVAIESLTAYQASKGAVAMLSRNAAVEYGVHGIRSNSVHPGLIRTPMSDGNADELNDRIIAATPLRRKGTPEDVAHGILYLAGDDSAYVTGTSLFIDGGYTAL